MKKKIYIMILLFVLFLPTQAFAKDTFSLSCDKEKYYEGDQMICRVFVTSAFKYNNIDFSMKLSNGLTLEDVRSNYNAYWKVKVTKNNVRATAKSLENQNKQEFAIILISTSEAGMQNIELNNIVLTNSEDKTTKTFDSFTTEIHVLSDNNLLSELKVNNKVVTDFNPNNNEYIIEINDQEEIVIDATAQYENSKITNIGKYKINKKENNFIVPIIVASESSINNIYLLKFVRKDFEDNKIDKTLKSLEILNNKNSIFFKFDPNQLIYEIMLDDSIKTLDIIPVLNNKDTSFIKEFGKQNITIKDGDNVALIKIKDLDGSVSTYTLLFNKTIKNKSANAYLEKIEIKGSTINYYKKVKNYTIYIKPKTDKLDIKATAENKKANILIQGNKNLTEGSIVKIMVTAENGTKNIYQLKVMYKKNNYFYIIIPIIGAGILGVVIYTERDKLEKKLTIFNSKKNKTKVKTNQKVNQKKKSHAKKKNKVTNKNHIKKNQNKKRKI